MSKFSEQLTDAFLAIIPISIAYFAGIVYLSFFLSHFSIDFTEVDISIENIFVFSFNVFSEPTFVALVFTTSSVVYAYRSDSILINLKRNKNLIDAIKSFSVIIMLSIFFIIAEIAKFSAEKRSADISLDCWIAE